MTKREQQVASIKLNSSKPTELKLSDLFTWIIWQYPRKADHGLCAAVRPPLAKHGWYPAVINQMGKSIVVHGEVPKPFKTPSDAADWLKTK